MLQLYFFMLFFHEHTLSVHPRRFNILTAPQQKQKQSSSNLFFHKLEKYLVYIVSCSKGT